MGKRVIQYLLKYFLGVVCLLLSWQMGSFVSNAEEPVIVVIDPGHGGENEGGKYGDYIEKELTIKVAMAMKEELEKYEGIQVYLTRTEDVDMSLQERADYAKEKNADFLVCLHFNMSEYHTLYGEECWVSAFENCYAKGTDFAKIVNELLSETGLHSRGIKTRLNSKGMDYYGIIRAATEYGIPSCLIEHCHLDHPNDAEFINHDSWPAYYGKTDATAIAKFYGLKSETLQQDFSNFTYEVTPVPTERMDPDKTGPEYCEIKEAVIDETAGVLRVTIAAGEKESRLCYYQYAFDDSEFFSPLQSWVTLRGDDRYGEMDVEIPLPDKGAGLLTIRVSNNYDLIADSEPVALDELQIVNPIIVETSNNSTKEKNVVEDLIVTEVIQEEEKQNNIPVGMWFVIVLGILVTAELIVVTKGIKRGRKKRG